MTRYTDAVHRAATRQVAAAQERRVGDRWLDERPGPYYAAAFRDRRSMEAAAPENYGTPNERARTVVARCRLASSIGERR